MNASWSAWSRWACFQKFRLDPEEWAALVREALSTREVEIRPDGQAWVIESSGLQLDAAWSWEDARRQCQRMGWRYR